MTGILVRLWMVLSLGWSTFIAIARELEPHGNPEWFATLAVAPWVIGPLVFFTLRWIFTGSLLRRP